MNDETGLAAVLAAFVATPTWVAARQVLDRNPELLSDEADAMLAARAAGIRGSDPAMAANLVEHRQLLDRCRAVGVDAAFAEKRAGTAPGGGDAREDSEDGTVPEDSVAQGDTAHDVVGGVPLTPTASDAFSLAGMERRASTPLDTAAVLAAHEAIMLDRATVDALPEGHSGRAGVLSNLGIALRARFESTSSHTDLDNAVAAGRDAVAATPHDHPDRPRLLSNLGNALHTRYQQNGSHTDLDDAITASRDALAATPHNHPDRPRLLSNLGNALHTRFNRPATRPTSTPRSRLDVTPWPPPRTATPIVP